MSERTRLPHGIRVLSSEGMGLIVSSHACCRHKRMCAALYGIIVSELERRAKPAECEGEWPTLDTTDWTDSELWHSVLDLLAMLSVLDRRDARDFARDLAVICYWAMTRRLGLTNPSDEGVYAPEVKQ